MVVGMPMIFEEKCNGCGLCVQVCPCQAIVPSGNSIRIMQEKNCPGCNKWCTLCEEVCPMGIPVRKLYRKVRKSVKDLFGYVPGEKEGEKGPLEFLGDGSYELPGAGR